MPRYIEPFKVLERMGTFAYRLALPQSLSDVHEVFHVFMLRTYTPNPAHVVDWGAITVDTDGTFEKLQSLSLLEVPLPSPHLFEFFIWDFFFF